MRRLENQEYKHEVCTPHLRTPEVGQEHERSPGLHDDPNSKRKREGRTSDKLMFRLPEAALSGADKQLTQSLKGNSGQRGNCASSDTVINVLATTRMMSRACLHTVLCHTPKEHRTTIFTLDKVEVHKSRK